LKTILCYGDSNTWGIDYKSGGRIPFDNRWANIMQRELGSGYLTIEEGLNGRTTAEDDPSDEYAEAKNGRKNLIPCLRSHYPIDLVILMLGTNDLKTRFFSSVDRIAENMGELVTMTRKELKIRQKNTPHILIAAPTPLGSTIGKSPFSDVFGGEKAIAPSMELGKAIERKAEELSCHFLDAGRITQPNDLDAVHFTIEGHRILGHAMASKVREIWP